MDEETFKSLQSSLKSREMILLKFTADWCQPCKTIKPICDEYVSKFSSSIKYFEVDIDESLDLYVKLKNKKMLNGIPALLAYYSGEKDYWYESDDSHLGKDTKALVQFFERCINYSSL